MGDIVKKWHFRPLKEVVYSVYGEKRARQIEHKARKQRESLAGVSNTAPLNVQVRLRAYCMIWELKQKYYKADTPLPYVSKASYKADEARERDIITKSLKLVVVDALQELRLDPSMRNLIMVEDLVNLPEGQIVEKLTDRVMCLRNMFNAEVNKQIQAEKTNYLRGTTPRTSNTKPISKYDKYKSTGNVQGMISEKLREYRDEDDY